MAKVSEMQGVSAHLEMLKTKDKRRHPARCIFAEGKGKERVCKSAKCQMYSLHCRSASRCEFYKEQND